MILFLCLLHVLSALGQNKSYSFHELQSKKCFTIQSHKDWPNSPYSVDESLSWIFQLNNQANSFGNEMIFKCEVPFSIGPKSESEYMICPHDKLIISTSDKNQEYCGTSKTPLFLTFGPKERLVITFLREKHSFGDVYKGFKCHACAKEVLDMNINSLFSLFDILPKLNGAPIKKIQVTYDGKKIIQPSMRLNPFEALTQPFVNLRPLTKRGKNYSFLLLDLDYNNSVVEESTRTYIQWGIFNIPESVLDGGNSRIFPYEAIKPQAFSGIHRYVFLLFEQGTGKPLSLSSYSSFVRTPFDVYEFNSSNNLSVIAGNFFTAENEDL